MVSQNIFTILSIMLFTYQNLYLLCLGFILYSPLKNAADVYAAANKNGPQQSQRTTG